jgi:chromosome segregation ATPase
MKKKKLKRKIKRLETRLNSLCSKLYNLEQKFEKNDKQLGEDWQAAIKVTNDGYKDLKRAKEEYEKAERSIKNTLGEFNKRIMIIEARTQIDYTKFVNTSNEPPEGKTCDTCMYQCLQDKGQDTPCMGCTADDKKMWKSKGG